MTMMMMIMINSDNDELINDDLMFDVNTVISYIVVKIV